MKSFACINEDIPPLSQDREGCYKGGFVSLLNSRVKSGVGTMNEVCECHKRYVCICNDTETTDPTFPTDPTDPTFAGVSRISSGEGFSLLF